MSGPLKPPPDAVDAQRSAADPRASAWVSANAGSGKTRVLTDRVIRLLLHGVEPARILCLTYTKAAAANMANRVFGTLGTWARLDDAALIREVESIEGRSVGPEELSRARRLFAEALECPGGLKVQTIHAFSERLLHIFPFEAGTPASFSVLDEAETAQLLDEARLAAASEALTWPGGPIGRAARRLSRDVAEGTLDSLLREAIGRRHEVEALLAAEGGLDGALARLRRDLGLDEDDTAEAIEQAICTSPFLPDDHLTEVIEALGGSGVRDGEQAERLRMCRALGGARRVETWLSVFLTGTGEPRKQVLTRSFCNANPGIASDFENEADRLAGLVDRRRALLTFEATTAFLTLAESVIGTYARLKRAAGKLDFDDLVHRVRHLFADERAAWVLYKLDEGIDHILIDEAQDTSPAQWAIVDAIGSEFFAGEGAREVPRTLFAVGDEKQSIYSFQGAQPKAFDEMRLRFERRAKDAGRVFREVGLTYSFRSTTHVLGAVDQVFEQQEARAGLTASGAKPVHQAVRSSAPGFVEIWKRIEPEPLEDGVAWDAPFDARNEESPPERLARMIAAIIRVWLDTGEARENGKPILPEDIIILVQRRNALFESVIRALKAQNVPVAGADRLRLNDHIAVMDCLAVADFVLLPEDDLTLATVLKSPLAGLDEEALFRLAHGREGTLWQALVRAAETDPALEEVRVRLAEWLDRADFMRPYEFFSDLLGRDGGRRRLLSRLGAEAADALDELLNLALAYEDAATPSLQGFLWWLRSTSREVKRTLDFARGEVRVMTVHNAKGLEASVVFLADTLTVPEAQKVDKLVAIAPRGETATGALAWRGVADRDPERVAAAAEAATLAQREEHRRLLYVAMTRAADRLYVCGHRGTKKPPEGNWYDLIQDALGPESTPIAEPDGEVLRWRWRASEHEDAEPCGPQVGEGVVVPVRPVWFDTPVPVERVARPLVASSLLIEGDRLQVEDILSDDSETSPGDGPTRPEARERGTLVHRLLQTLPDLEPSARFAAAERFLSARAGRLDAGLRRWMIETVLSLLADPAFAPVFAPGSRAEVAVAGVLTVDGEERPVSGIIDRLVVLPDRVLIVDFKTNRDPPETIEAAPPGYVAQLAAYRRLLIDVYPDRPVDAALLWTAVPRLMPAPTMLLDGALSSPDPERDLVA